MLVVLLAFATSLGALGVAAGTAALRCDGSDSCSTELALSIAALAPACLVAVLALLLLHSKLYGPRLRAFALAAGVGVASVPFAAFLLRDAWLVPLFGALVAGAVALALWQDHEAPPETSPSPATNEPAARAVPMGSPLPRTRAERTLAALERVAALNREVVGLCERLAQEPQKRR